MNSDRTVLTDAMWARVEHMLPGKATDPGVIERVFNALSDEFDLEYVFVDGTVVQSHQKATRPSTWSGGSGTSRRAGQRR